MSPTSWRQAASPRLVAVLSIVSVFLGGLIAAAPARATVDEVHRARVPAQTVLLHVLPPVRQPGLSAAPSTKARTVITATVIPAQAGRRVVLELRAGDRWKVKATVVTNKAGVAAFSVVTPRRDDARFRAVAESYRGLAPQRSRASLFVGWGSPGFVDEFDGSSLGAAWEHRIPFYNPWGGRACSKGSPAAVKVSDGALALASMPDPSTTELCTALAKDGSVLGQYPYRLNGHISTQHSADFLYGVAAARMRFQRDVGAHAAFWMQPRGLLDERPTPWGAEIDVVEYYGSTRQRDRMSSAVYAPEPTGDKVQYGGPVPQPNQFLADRSDAWWLNYHVFSVEWTPAEYVFRIDGHEVWRTDQGISHDPEFLILSMLSSDFELPTLGARQDFSQIASVDWVKFWPAP